MKFDIWTFLFQVINFIVLLFILKRLLYKPIREIMEKRKGIVAKNLKDAENTKREALEMKETYQKQIGTLKEEQSRALEKMNEEIAEEKKRLVVKAEKDANKIIEKEKALFETEKKRAISDMKDKTVDIVCTLTSNILKDISTEELHRAAYKKLLAELENSTSDISKTLRQDGPLTVELFTAFQPTEEDLKKFQGKIESLIKKGIIMNVSIDKSLIAGIKIKVSDVVYDSSLSGQVNALRPKLKESM